MEVAGRAQSLLEQSLLGELRTVVARSLSGLDMFAGTQLSPFDLAEYSTAEVGRSDVYVCLTILVQYGLLPVICRGLATHSARQLQPLLTCTVQ